MPSLHCWTPLFYITKNPLLNSIAYLVSLPSTFKRRSLDKEKLQVQSELAAIKSVQLELVKASKLERNIIKIDKEISKLKDGQEGVDKRLKPILRGLRLVVLIGVAIYFGTETVVHISPQVNIICTFETYCDF